MKISEAFDMYINYEVLASGGSINTCEEYKYAAKTAIGYFGNISIERVDLLRAQKYYLDLCKIKKQSTARGYVMCLRAVIGYCRRKGLKTIDPQDLKVPKRVKQEISWLSEEQVNEFAAIASRPMRGYPTINRLRNVLIIKMLYATGLRISELCRLNIDDIHNREFTVFTSKSKEPRVCYITEEVEDLIREYLSMREDTNSALFVSAQTGGERISPKTVQLMFRRVCAQSKFHNIHPHTMRHSFCTKLLSEGVDIRDTAELMGHQSWNTTKIYTHITNPRLKKIYEKAMRGA